MKKNRFVGRFATFFLIAGLFSVIAFSCKENDDDLVKPITITDIILTNEQFSILRDIMLTAEMTDALRSQNFTLFAPNNAAFGKANIFAASVITGPGKDSARIFLQNHIIKKTMSYADLMKSTSELTITQKTLNITKVDSTVAINKSDIVIRDVNAANGLIQVIDSVAFRK
ncbi:fasciclin domain-containing protein [Dyadobacter luticola]|uniref:Fasciclin domain-containing protein n=1 Tax=Dyadobacter luticola TaxID=1979387 RepID=A0A5R9KWS7_9BACT|nr:fasciclin domain-containing protein [Dyadobacter luticola]TLV00585.1 fasciclin domain-containing protein [Dyadobacter luticola]